MTTTRTAATAAENAQRGSDKGERQRPCRNPHGTLHDWRKMKMRWGWHQDERRQEILAWLRAAFAEGELALTGWRQVLDYLNGLGVRTRTSHVVTESVGRKWRTRLHMPVLPGHRGFPGRRRRSPAFSTSYLLLAWLAAQFHTGGGSLLMIALANDVGGNDTKVTRRVPKRKTLA